MTGAVSGALLSRRRGLGRGWVLVVLAAACVAVLALGAGRASAQVVFCPPFGDFGSECAQEQALADTLNSDVALLPPSVWQARIAALSDRAESLYPPVPIRPSDFCPSFTAYGAVGNYVAGLQQVAFPPTPVFPPTPTLVAIGGDVTAIRSAQIWTFFPPIGPAFPPNPCTQQ